MHCHCPREKLGFDLCYWACTLNTPGDRKYTPGQTPKVRTPCFSPVGRGATMFSKLGVQFLGLGYYYPSTEKNRQVYPVWCSRLHNHTLSIKKLCKKLRVRPNFGEVRTPQWLRPCGRTEPPYHIALSGLDSIATRIFSLCCTWNHILRVIFFWVQQIVDGSVGRWRQTKPCDRLSSCKELLDFDVRALWTNGRMNHWISTHA